MDEIDRRKHNLQQAISSLEYLIQIENDPEKISRYREELSHFQGQINSLPDGGGE